MLRNANLESKPGFLLNLAECMSSDHSSHTHTENATDLCHFELVQTGSQYKIVWSPSTTTGYYMNFWFVKTVVK